MEDGSRRVLHDDLAELHGPAANQPEAVRGFGPLDANRCAGHSLQLRSDAKVARAGGSGGQHDVPLDLTGAGGHPFLDSRGHLPCGRARRSAAQGSGRMARAEPPRSIPDKESWNAIVASVGVYAKPRPSKVAV